MIKLILAGLWICAVTMASIYGAVSWQAARNAAAPEPQKIFSGLESYKTRMISVPVISEGTVHGYVMAQFVFTIDGRTMKRLTVKPDVFLIDEAFNALYAEETLDFRSIKKHDLPKLSKRIAEGVNKRFGLPLIEDVLIQELNYISKDSARAGGKR